MSAKKFLDEMEASEKLESLEYRKVKCSRCNGVGVTESIGPILCPPCSKCGGDGYKWKREVNDEG